MKNKLFSESDQARIVEAIQQAERQTSGEVRVHVEPKTNLDPIDRAKEVFLSLGMGNTALKNGVLIYLAYEDRKFAIIGDSGIHEKVGEDFWKAEKDAMREHFVEGRFTEGLCKTIEKVGERLKVNFPFQKSDTNELSNEISFGGGTDE